MSRSLFEWQLVILIAAAAIAGGAGSSGGSLYIPLLLLVFWKQTFVAYTKSCSTATVLTVSLINIITEIYIRNCYNNRKNSKNSDKYGSEFIRYDVVSQMAPLSILGASIGVRLNKILPFYIVAVLLMILFGISGMKTCKKVQKIMKNERKRGKSKHLLDNQGGVNNNGNDENSYDTYNSEIIFSKKFTSMDDDTPYKIVNDIDLSNNNNNNHSNIESIHDLTNNNKTKNNKNKNKNNNNNNNNNIENFKSWLNILLIIFVWFCAFGCNAAMGGDGEASVFNIGCGSIEYWCIFAGLIITLFVCYIISRKYLTKSDLSYKAGIAAFCAGMASGTLGTGASTIQGPFLLSAIPNSKQASATSSFLGFCTESSALALFIILKLVEIDDALVYGGSAFIGAIIGKYIVHTLTKNNQRQWLIALLLFLYIGIATILILIMSLGKVIEDAQEGWSDEESFVGLCDVYVFDSDGFW